MRSHTRPSIVGRLRALLLALALLLMPLLSLASVTPALAASPIVVNDLGDDTTGSNSKCTLREAITNANTNSDTTGGDCGVGSGADTITFSVSGTITLGSTLPAINDEVTIDGTGRSITVSGNNSVQVMIVNSGKTLNLLELTIAHGTCSCSGGGIFNNHGTLAVTNSTFTNNSSAGGSGAIANNGTLTVTGSTFANNRATGNGNSGAGGAIVNSNGTLAVTNSTFTNNIANIFGGAIVNFGNPLVSGGTLNVTNSTFSGNSANTGVGGIHNTGTTTLKNTIVANNAGGDCQTSGPFATLTADAFNLDSDGSCGNATTKTQAELNLGPLANNGGSTQTMALGVGSAAIDAGDDAVCPSSDQRGLARPQGAHCDSGAFEFEPPSDTTAPTITSNVVGTQGSNGWYVSDVTVSWSVTDAESAISSQTGCDPSTVTSDTAGGTFTCTASSAGGTASKSVTVKRDATNPTVSYTGNAGTYTIDQSVSLSCTAADNLSGIASSTCANISGPAYSFPLGTTTRSASATDNAGNTGSGSTTFTVGVTFDSLCALSASFSTDPAVDKGLCDKLAAAKAAAGSGDTTTKNSILNAYRQQVAAQSGKAITKPQATILTTLSKAL